MLCSVAKPAPDRGVWWTAVFLALVVLYPLGRLVWISFQGPDGGLSLEAYRDVARHPLWGEAWRNTLLVAVLSTAIAVGLGTAGAVLTERTDLPGRTWWKLWFMFPVFIPSYVLSIAWLQWAGAEGWFNRLTGLPWITDLLGKGLFGIVLVMGVTHVPIVYLMVSAALHAVSPDYGRSARAAGAGPWRSFWSTEFPLIVPAAAGGALLSLAGAVDNFGIPAFLGIPNGIAMLSTFLYQIAIGLGPVAFQQAAALATMMGAAALLPVMAQGFLRRSSRYRIQGAGGSKPLLPLGPMKAVVVVLLAGWHGFTAAGPFVSLGLTSISPAYGVELSWENLTFSHYAALWSSIPAVMKGFWNSLTLSLPTAAAVLVLTWPVGRAWARRRDPVVAAADAVGMLPYTLPGMVTALAMLLTWWRPWPGLPLFQSGWVLLFVAYVARFFALGVRIWTAAWTRLPPELEEAGRIAGAGPGRVARQLILPLFWRDAAAGGLLIVMFSFTELTVSSLLAGAQGTTIGMALFNLESGGYTLESTALGTLITIGCAAVAAVVVGRPLSGIVYAGEEGYRDETYGVRESSG